jgi:hypothetical protein
MGEMDVDSRYVAAPRSVVRRAPVQIACRCPLRTHQSRVNGTMVVLNLKLMIFLTCQDTVNLADIRWHT